MAPFPIINGTHAHTYLRTIIPTHFNLLQEAVFGKLLEREIAFYDRTGVGEVGSYLSQVRYTHVVAYDSLP